MVFYITGWECPYLVTLKTTETVWAKFCRVPFTLFTFYEGPHQAPRKNPSHQNWYIYNIGANHSYSNICCWEIKKKSANNNDLALAKIFINKNSFFIFYFFIFFYSTVKTMVDERFEFWFINETRDTKLLTIKNSA